MTPAFHRRRCRDRQRTRRRLRPQRRDARRRRRREIALFRDGRRHRRAVERRHLARPSAPASARRSRWPAMSPDESPASASTRPARWSCWARAASPLPVGPIGDRRRNIIVWMDHRAIDQAERINATGHPVLRLCRRHDLAGDGDAEAALAARRTCPRTYEAAWQFFDLADFLTWRATGSLARSICTVTCKWTYLAHEGRWDAELFPRDRPRRPRRRGLRPHRHRDRRPAEPRSAPA